MKTGKVFIGLVLAITAQMAVLIGEYAVASLPFINGQEIKIKTLPVDPRSLFRGNYVQLRYGITNIDRTDLSTTRPLRNGEPVYVRLKANTHDLYEFAGISLTQPKSGLFIRGRVTHPSRTGSIQVKYGIEAFFMPKEKALKLEQSLRAGGIALIMISANGKAAIKDVIPDQPAH